MTHNIRKLLVCECTSIIAGNQALLLWQTEHSVKKDTSKATEED